MRTSQHDLDLLRQLLEAGLENDGGHHKQWYLEEALIFVVSLMGLDGQRYVDRQREIIGWEKGIAP